MNEGVGREDPDNQHAGPGAAELRRIHRGFSCLFWGMPITLLLFFRAAEMAVFHRIQIPSYILGMVVIYLGMGFLCFSGVESPSWRRVSRGGLFAAFLLIYFVPIVFWFTVLPKEGLYYTGNLFLQMISALWLMWAANQLASKLGVLTRDLDFAVEARICAWAVVVLMIIPLVVIFFFSGLLAVRYESTVLSEVASLRGVVPIWAQVFFLLPLSLTMMAVWKAKERCLCALSGEMKGPYDR